MAVSRSVRIDIKDMYKIVFHLKHSLNLRPVSGPAAAAEALRLYAASLDVELPSTNDAELLARIQTMCGKSVKKGFVVVE